MSELNGVHKITKRSLVKFQFGEEEPPIQLDVIEVFDEWYEVNYSLRVLEDKMWTLPKDKIAEFGRNRLAFVQGIVTAAYASQHSGRQAPLLTRLESEEFIRMVEEEADTMRNFTSTSTVEASSAPESTEEPAKNFSQ